MWGKLRLEPVIVLRFDTWHFVDLDYNPVAQSMVEGKVKAAGCGLVDHPQRTHGEASS